MCQISFTKVKEVVFAFNATIIHSNAIYLMIKSFFDTLGYFYPEYELIQLKAFEQFNKIILN